MTQSQHDSGTNYDLTTPSSLSLFPAHFPDISDSGKLFPFCLSVLSVEGITLKVDADKFQIQATLFDSATGRFIGRTWTGPPVITTLDNLEPSPIIYKQNVYCVTTVQDEKLSAVLEFICSSPHSEKYRALGWTLVPFPSPGILHQQHVQKEEKSALLFCGTPRVLLLQTKDKTAETFPTIFGCKVKYKLFTHSRLLRVSHLLPKNCFVGGNTRIPGLAEVSGRDALWKPNVKKALSDFILDKVAVFVPQVKQYEKHILSALERENYRSVMASVDTIHHSTKAVAERRLKVYVYNGWTSVQEPQVCQLMLEDAHYGSYKSSLSKPKHHFSDHISEAAEMTRLHVQHELIFIDVPEDPKIALVFVLEYLVSCGNIKNTCTFPVPLLCGMWFPAANLQKALEGGEIQVPLKGGPGRTPDGHLLLRFTDGQVADKPSPRISFTFKVKGTEGQTEDKAVSVALISEMKQPSAEIITTKPADEVDPAKENERKEKDRKQEEETKKQRLRKKSRRMAAIFKEETLEPSAMETVAKVVEASTNTASLQESATPVTFGPYVPVTPATPRYPFSGQAATRGALTTLHSFGFKSIRDRHGHPAVTIDPGFLASPDASAVDKLLETQDVLQCNTIIFQFLAFSSYVGLGCDFLPKVIFITFQFYRFPPTRTERLILKQLSPGLIPEPDYLSYILHPFHDSTKMTDQNPGFSQRYTIDPAYFDDNEDPVFLDYLLGHWFFMDVWDGDSLLYLGSSSFPLKYLLRQGQEAIQATLELDVLYSEYPDEPEPLGNMTSLRGKLHVRIGNVGSPLPMGSLRLLQDKGEKKVMMRVPKTKNDYRYVQKARPLVETDRKLLALLRSHSLKVGEISKTSSSLTDDQRRKLARMVAVRKDAGVSSHKSLDMKSVHRESKQNRWNELKIIEAYREHHKHERIMSVLEQAISHDKFLYPIIGHASCFEFEFVNVLLVEQRISIEIDSPEIKIVTSSKEWLALKKVVGHEIPAAQAEHQFILCTTNRESCTWQVLMQPREKMLIPFKFQCFMFEDAVHNRLESATGHHFTTEGLCKAPLPVHLRPKTITVMFKLEDGRPACVLNVHLRPIVPSVDLVMHFYPPENDLFKKWIRMPVDVASKAKHPHQLAVRCSDPSVVCGIHRTSDQKDSAHVYLKVSCGSSGSTKTFYMFIFADHFHHKPVHVWSVMTVAQHRVDVVCIAGAKYETSLILRGSHMSRLVQLFSSHPKELCVEPEQPFVLTSGSIQDVGVKILSLHPGRRHMHITLVDRDLTQLICSWLVVVTCHTPSISKVFRIHTPIQRGALKQISFTNPYQSQKSFVAHSSHPDLVHLQDASFTLEPGCSHILGLLIRPQGQPSLTEVLVYINDAEEHNEETFGLIIEATN